MKFKTCFIDSEPLVIPEFKPMFIRPEGTRICEADGRPAFFHRWVQDDKALLQMMRYATQAEAKEIKSDFDLHGYAPYTAQIEKISQTFALVEYADGTVGKVEPEKIKFTDRRVPSDD